MVVVVVVVEGGLPHPRSGGGVPPTMTGWGTPQPGLDGGGGGGGGGGEGEYLIPGLAQGDPHPGLDGVQPQP